MLLRNFFLDDQNGMYSPLLSVTADSFQPAFASS